jgi:chaperone LolA
MTERRNDATRLACATVLLCVIPSLRLSVAVQDPGPVLDRASAAYQTVQNLSAEFTQIVTNPMLGAPDTSRGTLYLVRPNQFAMRFSRPRGDRVVADGRHLWLSTPSTTPGQVIRTAIPTAGATGPNFLGQFVERPRARYTARYLRGDSLTDGAADVIALVPKDPVLPYTDAVIWVDRDDGLLRRIEIVEVSGQRRTVMLRNVRVNRGVPTREVTFSPPAGSRVVDQ